MRIVIATDSFKGSLSSEEVADAVMAGLLSKVPDAEVLCIPLGDGGEGTAQSVIHALVGDRVECEVADPLMRPVEANYGICRIDSRQVAVMDMASANGLTLLTESERNGLTTSTFGTGEMVLDAIRRGCRDFIVGIGGSATCDAGMGMLAAFGVKFFDKNGRLLTPCGASLNEIHHIDTSPFLKEVLQSRFTIVCDVANPLFGLQGAAFVYAPQKGVAQSQLPVLDEGLRNLSNVCKMVTGKDFSDIPGGGAAGGLGYAFMEFLNAELKSGIDTVLGIVRFDDMIEGADLIITGEGKIDAQTLYGKLPMGVCRRGNRKNIPTIAIAGVVEDEQTLLNAGFSKIYCITPPDMPHTLAMHPDIARQNIISTIKSLKILPNRQDN